MRIKQSINLLLTLFLSIQFGCQTPIAKIEYRPEIRRSIAQDEPSKLEAFDEVYGMSGEKKKVRAPYKGIMEIYERMSEKERIELEKISLKEFDGDNPLLTLPRVLSNTEYDLLQRGTDQRGKALKAFLEDIYSDDPNIIKDGILPRDVFEGVINRSAEEDWAKYIKPKYLDFWFGPDIIRGPPTEKFPEGQFLVVEDNPSFIGGMGDLLKAREIIDKYNPDYQKEVGSPDPSKFYEKIANRYRKEAAKHDGIPVMVQYIHEMAADNEDKRAKIIFEHLGIPTVYVDPWTKNNRRNPRIKVYDDGAWLVQDGKKVSKVGYMVTNMNPNDLELSHPANRKYRLNQLAEWDLEQPNLKKSNRKILEKLSKPDPKTGKIDYDGLEHYFRNLTEYQSQADSELGIKGIFDTLFSGKMGMTNTPGTEFLGDKELYMYVEKFIKYYLDEEPIVRNMPTTSFRKFTSAGAAVTDEDAIESVFKNIEKWVVKGVDGRGGDAVWVGPKIKPEQIPGLKEMIRGNPGRYIFQEYNALSTIEGNIGDIRVISSVVGRDVLVADVPWARVVPMSGDGKVNISANGFEAVVLVRKGIKKKSCKFLLEGLLH